VSRSVLASGAAELFMQQKGEPLMEGHVSSCCRHLGTPPLHRSEPYRYENENLAPNGQGERNRKETLLSCGELTLAGLQMPTKVTLSLPSSAGQRRENRREGSWVKIRAGTDYSPITVIGKTDLT